MIYCFDTSALNQLCDDADHRPLVAGLLAAHSVYVTAVNCLEVLGTKDEDRRNLLQLLLRELARGEAPLALPIDLLKLLTIEYGAGRDRPDSKKLNYGMSVDQYFTLDGKKSKSSRNSGKSGKRRSKYLPKSDQNSSRCLRMGKLRGLHHSGY